MSPHRFDDVMTYDIMFKKVSLGTLRAPHSPAGTCRLRLYIIFNNSIYNVMTSSPFICRGFMHDIFMTFSLSAPVLTSFVPFALLATFYAGGVS